jgi:hypothetical protein
MRPQNIASKLSHHVVKLWQKSFARHYLATLTKIESLHQTAQGAISPTAAPSAYPTARDRAIEDLITLQNNATLKAKSSFQIGSTISVFGVIAIAIGAMFFPLHAAASLFMVQAGIAATIFSHYFNIQENRARKIALKSYDSLTEVARPEITAAHALVKGIKTAFNQKRTSAPATPTASSPLKPKTRGLKT